jgi:hypothetical protein
MRTGIFQKAIIFASMLAAAVAVSVSAQSPATNMKPSVVTGDVVSASAEKIVLQTKDGQLDVPLSATTQYKRVTPENPDPRNAVASSFSDIGTGDKLLVTGFFSGDKKTLPARSVYLMTKADIAQKQVKDSERWTKGIAGKVTAVNPQTNQISVEVRGLMNTTTIVINPKADTAYRRYAPNSVKYSESKAGTIGEIQPGDMLRAAGEKSPDGASFTAEEIVSGAFQTVAGTVKSVDTTKNEVVITDMQSKKDVTIDLGTATLLKKFPEEWAQRMAQFQGGQGGGMRPGGMAGAPSGGQGSAPANGQGAPGAGGQGRGFGGGQRGGIDEMLDRFPTITAADLKPGDVIAVSSSKNHTPDRISAIKLLAGVEPFLKAAQMQAARSGQRGQSSPSLNIPGLDGVDLP